MDKRPNVYEILYFPGQVWVSGRVEQALSVLDPDQGELLHCVAGDVPPLVIVTSSYSYQSQLAEALSSGVGGLVLPTGNDHHLLAQTAVQLELPTLRLTPRAQLLATQLPNGRYVRLECPEGGPGRLILLSETSPDQCNEKSRTSAES